MTIRLHYAVILAVTLATTAAACGTQAPEQPSRTVVSGTAATSSDRAPVPSLEPTPTSTLVAPPPAPRSTTGETTTFPTTHVPPTPAPTELPAAWRGTDLERIPTENRNVALTFDGCASDTALPRILATLAQYGVPATFFVTGDFARAYPEQVRTIAAAGHPVGNHSNTHPSFPDLTDDQIRAELAAAESSITALTGRASRPLFRFPFGARTDADIGVVNDAGYVPVRWTVDSLGWKGTSGGLSRAAVTERVLSTAVPGQIVLMHVGANPDDGTTLDADALPGIIDGLRARGYGFVDLTDLVG